MAGRRVSDPCVQCMSEECHPHNVGLQYDKPQHFATSQWPRIGLGAFTGYRVCVAVLMVVWCCLDFWEEAMHYYRKNYGVWFVFATNWSLLCIAMSAVLQAIAAGMHLVRCKRQHESEPYPGMPRFHKAVWLFHVVAGNSSFVISTSFWMFLAFSTDTSDFLKTPMSRIKHSLNISYVFVDLLLSAIPVRMFHVVYPGFMGVVYTIFNAVYFTSGGRGPGGHHYAYYVLDWDNPRVAVVTTLLGFIQTMASQFVIYGIYALRLWLHRKCCGHIPESDEVPLGDESESILSKQNVSSKYKAFDDVEIDTTQPPPTAESLH